MCVYVFLLLLVYHPQRDSLQLLFQTVEERDHWLTLLTEQRDLANCYHFGRYGTTNVVRPSNPPQAP